MTSHTALSRRGFFGVLAAAVVVPFVRTPPTPAPERVVWNYYTGEYWYAYKPHREPEWFRSRMYGEFPPDPRLSFSELSDEVQW